MKRYLFCVYFLLGCFLAIAHAFAANLEAHIDHDRVYQDETIQLSITANERVSGVLDVRILEKNFYIVANAQSQQLTIINGKETVTTQWIIGLMPKRTGDFVIPALTIGRFQTQPISVHVLGKKAMERAAETKRSAIVFMVTTATPQQPYVQSQVVYTVRVYYRAAIQDAALTEPKVDDALIMPLGEEKTYQTSENGKIYAVFERNYAIFPRTSGEMKIYAPVLTGLQMDEGMHNVRFANFDMLRTMTKPIRISSAPVVVNVQNVPAANQRSSWLPAQQVALTESWSSTIDTLKVGTPVTRTITLTADGLPAEQLPVLAKTALPQVKVYAEKPLLSSSTQHGVMVGQRVEKITYIPTQAGQIVIPSIRLSWWDVNNRRLKTAVIAGRVIQVKPIAVRSNTTSSTDNVTPVVMNTSPVVQPDLSSKRWLLLRHYFSQREIQWLVIISGVAFVVGYVWWYRRKKHNEKVTVDSHQQKQYLDMLHQACKSGDAVKTKVVLLQWAQARWPTRTIIYLSDIGIVLNSSELKTALHELDEALYANHAIRWDGRRLWHILSESLRWKESSKTKSDEQPLPPLNPE